MNTRSEEKAHLTVPPRASPPFRDLLRSEVNEQIHGLIWNQTIPSKSDLL